FRNFRIGSLVFQPVTAALVVGGVVAVLLVVHGFGMKAAGRTKGGAPFETDRKWDRKHPDRRIAPRGSSEPYIEKTHAAEEASKAQENPTADSGEKKEGGDK
ncbi:MAG: hydrogenase, partial [Coriobacteriia bacterium]|nr:hydrogenase [Coriobacteriia bacterium]